MVFELIRLGIIVELKGIIEFPLCIVPYSWLYVMPVFGFQTISLLVYLQLKCERNHSDKMQNRLEYIIELLGHCEPKPEQQLT